MMRHLKNAVITGNPTWLGSAPDGTTVECTSAGELYAPVAVALTEDEITALAEELKYYGIQIDILNGNQYDRLTTAARTAVNAILAAADDLEGGQK